MNKCSIRSPKTFLQVGRKGVSLSKRKKKNLRDPAEEKNSEHTEKEKKTLVD